jgi:PAS domain S-box-containing protein
VGRRALREALAFPPLRAVELADGEDVVATFLSVLPDVVLLDCWPGSAETEQACSRIRALRGSDWRPVVGIVAEDDEEGFGRAMAAGFDDLVSRPPRPMALKRRIAMLLRERRARENERVLSEAAALAPTGIAVLDVRPPEHAVLFVNHAFERLTGYRSDEVVGTSLPGARARASAEFAEALEMAARGIPHRLITSACRKDGGLYWADVTVAPLVGARGDATHLIVAQCDVSAYMEAMSIERDREALEERVALRTAELEAVRRGLDERRRFTETLLNQITTGVVTADRAGRVSFANRMALETLALSPDGALGQDVTRIFGGSGTLLAALKHVADGGETRAEFVLTLGDGHRLDLGMNIVRAGSEAPADMAFVLLFRDLGDRRQFEMELRRVERLSAIGNMVAGFAHEVRNPLAGVQALAEALLAEMPSADPRREYAMRMLALLGRVERFVRASLHFGEPKPPTRRRHRACDLLAVALEAMTPRWGRRGVPPATELEPRLPDLEVDEAQIVECLLALLENALDAAGDPARVQVRVSVEPGEGLIERAARVVRFDVRDEGPGIPESLLSRVFDPFFTTKAKGTGLGLAIAQTLVRENGGRLLVRSNPGIETVFSLVLPEAGS